MRAGSIPLLVVRPAGTPPFPTVLWFHGLGVSKHTHEKELQQLAADRAGPARYLELSGASHLMNDADWTRAMTETVAWLRRFNS